MEASQGRGPGSVFRVGAVVVAAGSGVRFGGPKQFALLGGIPVVERSVTLAKGVAELVVLVVPPGYDGPSHGADRIVEGGSSRSVSVRAGLAEIDEDIEIVVIHDAARPLTSPALFGEVVAALCYPETMGAVCGVGISDTVKAIDDVTDRTGTSRYPSITATVDRKTLVVVQTPQAFFVDTLRRAYAEGGDATDDAALVEALGATVRVVPGDRRNIKLTDPGDLEYAMFLLERMS